MYNGEIMNHIKIVMILILFIFSVGMIMGTASASHTFQKGKYKVTISDKKYNKLKNNFKSYHKKVGSKKIKKWVNKKIKTYETWMDKYGNIYKTKSWNPYNKVGYNAKYVKSKTKYYDDGSITWDYFKIKKTVKKSIYLHAYYVPHLDDYEVVVNTDKY